MRRFSKAFLLGLIFLKAFDAYSGERRVLFREDFNDLNRWKPFYFKKIEKHSSYSVESSGNETYLKAESNGSASAIIYDGRFSVYEYPQARWRWKVENVYQKGNAATKEGDDYPLRIYLIFEYDPQKAGFWEKAKYSSARLIYGEYPPHSSLNYIWANRKHSKPILTNTYTEKSKMIPLQQGESNLGKWIIQEVNILEDYKRAFGGKPPRIASIAIMNDSDNTGEHSVSYLDFIEIYTDDH